MRQNIIAYCKFNDFYQFDELNRNGQQAFSKAVLNNWIHFVFPADDKTFCLIMLGTETEIDIFGTYHLEITNMLPEDDTIEGVRKRITEGVSIVLSNYFENRLNLDTMFVL